RADLAGQRRRVLLLAPAGAIGGVAGAHLLTVSSEALFVRIVPWLILAACGLLAVQPRLRTALDRRRTAPERRGAGPGTPATSSHGPGPAAVAATAVGAVYGGYFGAGLGIIL